MSAPSNNEPNHDARQPEVRVHLAELGKGQSGIASDTIAAVTWAMEPSGLPLHSPRGTTKDRYLQVARTVAGTEAGPARWWPDRPAEETGRSPGPKEFAKTAPTVTWRLEEAPRAAPTSPPRTTSISTPTAATRRGV